MPPPSPLRRRARRSPGAGGRGRRPPGRASATRSGRPARRRCARLETLRTAVLHGIGETLDVDFRPLLRAAEIPAARISAVQVGRTAWLTPARAADARDLRLRAIVGLAAEGARAAA